MSAENVDGIEVMLIMGVLMLGVIITVAVYQSFNTTCTVTIEGVQINGAFYKVSGMQYGDRETATIDKLTFETKGEYCGELIKNIRTQLEEADRK